MNCRDFEQTIDDLLIKDLAPERRAELLAAAKLHARDCPGCRASDLWTLLDAEPGQRLPDPDPGPEYWETFNPRLARRLTQGVEVGTAAAGGGGPVRWRTGGWIAAVAAVVLVFGWLGLRQLPDAGEGDPLVLPEELVRVLEASPNEIAMSEVELVVGADSVWRDPLWPTDMQAMLADADAQLSADMAGLLDPFDGSSALDLLADELDLERTNGLFPDSEGLDAEARRALIDWLARQPEGVS